MLSRTQGTCFRLSQLRRYSWSTPNTLESLSLARNCLLPKGGWPLWVRCLIPPLTLLSRVKNSWICLPLPLTTFLTLLVSQRPLPPSSLSILPLPCSTLMQITNPLILLGPQQNPCRRWANVSCLALWRARRACGETLRCR